MKGAEEVVESRFFGSKPESAQPSEPELVSEGWWKVRTLPEDWPQVVGRRLKGRDPVGVKDDRNVCSVIQEVVAVWSKVGAVEQSILDVSHRAFGGVSSVSVLKSFNKDWVLKELLDVLFNGQLNIESGLRPRTTRTRWSRGCIAAAAAIVALFKKGKAVLAVVVTDNVAIRGKEPKDIVDLCGQKVGRK